MSLSNLPLENGEFVSKYGTRDVYIRVMPLYAELKIDATKTDNENILHIQTYRDDLLKIFDRKLQDILGTKKFIYNYNNFKVEVDDQVNLSKDELLVSAFIDVVIIDCEEAIKASVRKVWPEQVK